jgi:hypothetical protein
MRHGRYSRAAAKSPEQRGVEAFIALLTLALVLAAVVS